MVYLYGRLSFLALPSYVRLLRELFCLVEGCWTGTSFLLILSHPGGGTRGLEILRIQVDRLECNQAFMHFLGTLENLNSQGCRYNRNVLSKRFKGKRFKCLRDCYIIRLHSVVFSSTCNLKLAGIHTVVLGTLVSLESVSGKPLPCPCSSFKVSKG